jgi:hypothetical protein
MNSYGVGNSNLGLNQSNTSNLTSSSLGNVNTGLQSGLNNTSSMNNSSYLNANSSLTKYNLNEVSSFSNPVTPSGPLT